MIANENIIRNALNESIDEFLLEEGAFDGLKNWWNNSTNGQKVKNGLSNVWNGVKNGVAMYMDSQTNGQWNQKYGIYANSNGKTVEMYYLNKWFKFHLDEIRQIDYYLRNPRNAQTEIEWRIDPKTGEKKGVQKINNYDNIQSYAIQNINAQSFNKWIGYFIKNRNALDCIDKYINDCSRTIKDINSATQWLNVGAFLASKVGQYYIKMTKSQQVKRQQDRDWKNYFRNRQNSGAYN